MGGFVAWKHQLKDLDMTIKNKMKMNQKWEIVFKSRTQFWAAEESKYQRHVKSLLYSFLLDTNETTPRLLYDSEHPISRSILTEAYWSQQKLYRDTGTFLKSIVDRTWDVQFEEKTTCVQVLKRTVQERWSWTISMVTETRIKKIMVTTCNY